MDPRRQLSDATRVVVKVGTHVVTEGGVRIALGRVHGIVEDIADLVRRGRQVLLVSSGSIALGMRALGLAERPDSLGLRQACAAIGQGKLMELYTRAFEQLGLVAAQVLLTQEDLADRDRALCLRTTLFRLLELGVVPILNENDSVSVREIMDAQTVGAIEERSFGDNDGLSARVAVAVDADALVLLSDVDGLRTADPRTDPDAERIAVVAPGEEPDASIGDAPSSLGRGGMGKKLAAARIAAHAGVSVVIASGERPGELARILRGEDVGTIVLPAQRRRARRRYIAVEAPCRGALVVNDGAVEALGRRKASLLAVGVVGVEGQFGRGDVVEIRDVHGRIHGRGLSNYTASECRRIAGHHSDEFERLLGYRGYDTVVGRDNLVWEDL
ncbi:MAG: glutamate 5-kinase [Deltaproteobacteria bacterium]|nr:MAG: glutamate 5-kinase [Deltaproteobacteria bacterium]